MSNLNPQNKFLENTPNASKLINSLRHLDYNNVAAICDIIDNSIDANATKIFVSVLGNKSDGVSGIEIIDNGNGMDWDVLDEALRLGSDTEKNPAFDLGMYGMGLITASISFGRRLEVLSKSKKGSIILGVQDLDEIAEKNSFIKEMKVLEGEEAKKTENKVNSRFKESNNHETWTEIDISKIDKSDFIYTSVLVKNLINKLGQVFRKFIQSEKCKIYVNEIEVKAIDPIYDFEPTVLYEDEIKLEEGNIKIVITEIKDYGREIDEEKNINIPNQGFYVLRNNREILSGETLGIFSKHNDLNLLRIEFNYPATLDQLLNTNFSKQKIRLDQSLADKVQRICQPFIKQIRKKSQQKARVNREQKEDFSDVEKFITHKAHLLKIPKPIADLVQQKVTAEVEKPKIKKEHLDSPRLNMSKRPRIDIERLKVKFEAVTLGEKGPLFDTDQEQDKVVVKWNVDHPFYLHVVSANFDKPEIFNPIAFLVYCYACSELSSSDQSYEMLSNIRYDVGRNLAVLMK